MDNNGASTHRLIRIPKDELATWDAEHDEAGNLRRRNVSNESDKTEEVGEKNA